MRIHGRFCASGRNNVIANSLKDGNKRPTVNRTEVDPISADRQRTRVSLLLCGGCSLFAVLLGAGCGSNQEACVDKSKAALETCQSESQALTQQLNDLKIKLAQALENPGSIKIDPKVLEIDGQPPVRSGGTNVREGSLKQDQVVKVLSMNKSGLQACYNRALKRNSALHHEAITQTLAFKIKNTGQATNIRIRPNRDPQMITCMKQAVGRWKFPSFSGASVDVETPVTLRPRK